MTTSDTPRHDSTVNDTVRRAAAVAILHAALGTLAACTAAAPEADQRTFASAEEAVAALVSAAKSDSLDNLVAIFGSEGRSLIDSSDPATARRNRQVFLAAVAERWHLADHGADGRVLVIGNEDWPFPLPLVKGPSGWRFDTPAGKEEILSRRIGRNELAAIRIARAYVIAQRLYARHGRDGRPPGRYATRFHSDPGRQNGLYWAVARGEKLSPLGELVAQAGDEGRSRAAEPRPLSPFHGYYFRILTAQGVGADGGARDYLVDGEMSAGFALVAWPAQYGVTGIMTFLINQDGIPRENDLGPDTDQAARTMTKYDPDESWRTVE